MTAATTERVVRFSASRPQICTRCAGPVVPGTRGGYAPGAQVLCEPCCGGPDKRALIEAQLSPVTVPTPSGESPDGVGTVTGESCASISARLSGPPQQGSHST